MLLGRQTKQVIIEIDVKAGSHVAIDDIKLEDCLPGNITFILMHSYQIVTKICDKSLYFNLNSLKTKMLI